MVTTKERSPIAASISAVAAICASAPSSTQGQKFGLGCGRPRPLAISTAARNNNANGNPNRNRTCVAPAVPSFAVNSRCMALRAVWQAAAMIVKTAQSGNAAIADPLYAAPAAAHARLLTSAQADGRMTAIDV